MAQELSLDDMAQEMRKQQGLANGSPKKLGWNPKTMKFEAFSSYESVPDGFSDVSDAASKGFYA